ncbi:sigma-54-dependent Fis family transcriptional regulator [Shewanella cyperi]|uniref:sigma-54-dependent Fis family transcriptional regulator n=1 Tax=Shewanella cyperi TaxID=2814292 RepID=UPI001A951038|nr:sigma-54-dependent Fis family transcriptional regulator [Shewanella cyperi]QSX40695.1 sigma-54-dependent Fis family transcriptional regulator [Shewanella cyperi]
MKASLQPWLADSWRRSADAGLHENRPADGLRLTAADLDERLESRRQLVSLVEQHALPLFSKLMAHSDSRLILSDSDGFVLRHWGLVRYSDRLANVALDCGVNWLEEHKGTNAIGTALRAGQALSVVGEQHYFRQHRFMSCSASPIFAPNGELIGALDITSERLRHTQQTLMLISSLAQQVETALLCSLPGGRFRVDLAASRQLLSSGWQGILIADDNGRLLGLNPMARQYLGRAQPGADLAELLGEDWQRQSSQCPWGELHLATSALGDTPSKKIQGAKPVKFHDPKLEQAWQLARKVVSRQIPLLIQGETGVGKEHFVRQLYSDSHRKGPLVAVNCAALPAELVESELFGYQAGAFTGAARQGYLGKIRQADGGFLFLDEIGELPLAAQGRLLRVLQEREVTPVGSLQAVKVDIQVVAATHMDLQSMVDEGRFRQDLYFRLNGLQVILPPLRQRSDRSRIIHKLHRKYRSQDQGISTDLLGWLESYAWPGNLRELDNLMQVVCLLAEDEPELQLQHVPEALLARLRQGRQHDTGQADGHDCGQADGKLEQRMRQQILTTLAECNGNVSACARRLGISRNQIYRRLRQSCVRG